MTSLSPIYIQGLQYFFGQLGDASAQEQTRIDYKSAFDCFRQAYHEGDLNAGWMLARCYAYGYGVPQDCDHVLRIARQLAERGYAGAGFYLALAYENGWGVDMDLARVDDIVKEYLPLCIDAEGEVGLDESIRQECLMLLTPTDEMEPREQEEFYRRFAQQSRFPTRYAVLAEYLMLLDADKHQDEALDLLEEGCEAHDPTAMVAMGRILSQEDHPYAIYKPEIGRKLLISSGQGYVTLAHLAQLQGDDKMRNHLLDLYIQQARYGFSLMRREGELDCTVHCVPAMWLGIIKVFDHRVTRTLIDNNAMAHCVEQARPRLLIKGIERGVELTVRVRSAIDELDKSFTLLPASDELLIDLVAEHGIIWSEDLDVELSSKSGSTRMLISALALSVAQPFTSPPFVLTWRKRFLRGYALQIVPLKQDVEQLKVHLAEDSSSEMVSIAEADSVEMGQEFFRGGAKLHMGQPFVITHRGHAPFIGVIAPPPRGPQVFELGDALKLINKLMR